MDLLIPVNELRMPSSIPTRRLEPEHASGMNQIGIRSAGHHRLIGMALDARLLNPAPWR